MKTGKVGIIAGSGELPLILAQKLQQSGRSVFLLLVEREADPKKYEEFPSEIVPITKVGRFLKLLARENCQQVTMVGPVRRPNFKNIFPDKEGFKLLGKIGSSLSKGDDGLLRAITGFIEEKGFTVVGPHEFSNDFVSKAGSLGTVFPTEEQVNDIQKGIEIGQVIGQFDIGQSLVIRRGYVLAVEAAEGTESMLSRCAEFAWDTPSGVLIKMPKPGQELRTDMPAIGVDTVMQVTAAGLCGIAIEAEHTLLIDREKIIQAANESGLFIEAFTVQK